MNNDSVKIKIYGSEYSIKAEAQNREYIKKVAEYLDNKLREFHSIFPSLPFNKLAVLTSLNIVDELLQYKLKSGTEIDQTEQQIDKEKKPGEDEIKAFLEKVKILLEED